MTEADSSPKPRVSSASRALRDYLPRDKRGLRWFLTPQEAINILGDTEEKILNRKKCRYVWLKYIAALFEYILFVNVCSQVSRIYMGSLKNVENNSRLHKLDSEIY